MAILLPTLQQVRKQAKAAACQAKLRQWGLAFCMYMNEHNDQFDLRETRETQWWRCARPYYADLDALFLCPMATRYEVNKNDPKWAGNMAVGYGLGSKFTAWRISREFWNRGQNTPLCGSYGWNAWVPMTYSAQSGANMRPAPARSSMPFLLDCAAANGYGHWHGAPPVYDGDLSYGTTLDSSGEMKVFCINRHERATNSLFLDWSVRTVGFKELWTLKWWAGYDVCGPWTKAGGVKPDDWPAWMRHFKDY